MCERRGGGGWGRGGGGETQCAYDADARARAVQQFGMHVARTVRAHVHMRTFKVQC